MKAVVLAAGRGTRLQPLTDAKPKALVEVAGRPLLSHVFDALCDLPVHEVVVVIGYRGEDIIDYYGHTVDGIPVTYTEQEAPRGLADALVAAEDHLTEDFVVVNGDNVFDLDLREVIDVHQERSPAATLLVEETTRERASEVGVLDFDDGEPVSIVEKPTDPPSTTTLTGFSVCSPLVLDAARLLRPSERDEYELAEAFDLLLYADHDVEVVFADGWRWNVNTHEDVKRATEYLENDAKS